jgi:hypothetical protein
MRRLRLLAAIVIAACHVAPASAYRVYLDHDTDGDLTTFVNEVAGPVSAPITYVVEFDSLDVDAGVPTVAFHLSWDCESSGCEFGTRHGSILDDWQLPETGGPFMFISEGTCLDLTCECRARRTYSAYVLPPPPPIGHHAFGTQELSRIGDDSSCGEMIHDVVEFRLDCPQCNYRPGDEARTRMLIRTMDTAVNDGVAADRWGRIKAAYR